LQSSQARYVFWRTFAPQNFNFWAIYGDLERFKLEKSRSDAAEMTQKGAVWI